MTPDNNHFAVSVSREFVASPEQVFDAWLDPTMVRHWFAPGLGEMVRTDIEPSVGGAFYLDQRRGSEIARHWGRYMEIERPRRLVFTGVSMEWTPRIWSRLKSRPRKTAVA